MLRPRWQLQNSQPLSAKWRMRRVGASKMSGGIFGEALLGVLRLRFRKIRPRL